MLGGGGPFEALLERYLASQSVARRAWDWAKLFANPLPVPLPLSAPAAARLFRRSTPRALVYAAGALAYRALAEPSREPDPIERWLPVRQAARYQEAEARRRAIVAFWRWAVRNS
jgi:hypothetical protein